jgi:hypothetical protein
MIDQFTPGQRVVITQQIPQRARVWTTKITGVVVMAEQKKTGSWFAHSKDDKLWLDRVTIRKDDGEVAVINLDEFTHVELLAAAPAKPAEPKPHTAE